MDPTAFHIVVQLFRNGTFSIDDAAEIADRLAAEGEGDAAHAVRAAVFEATMEQPAESRRAQIRLISDGGNEVT